MEDLLGRRQSGRWVVQMLNRYCVPAIVIIVLFTIVATPLVNRKSRQ